MKKISYPLAAGIAVLLAACGNDAAAPAGSEPVPSETNAPTSADCTFLGRSGRASTTSSVGSGCPDCSVVDTDASVDRNASSFAYIDIPASIGSEAAIRAIAAAGTVFPAGHQAGVLAKIDKSLSVELSSSLIVRTFLNGTLQEEKTLDSTFGGEINGAGGTGKIYLGFTASSQFDAVEFALAGAMEGISAEVYEFCAGVEPAKSP